jgi:hypothetical protein
MALRYCALCKRNVDAKKEFNSVVFILLFIFTCIGGPLYILFYSLQTPGCPICKGKALEPPRTDLLRD